MSNLTAESVGKRVNVTNIKTQEWQSDRYITNGILLRITDKGIPVVTIDTDSEHSNGFTGGYLHPLGYNIEVIK